MEKIEETIRNLARFEGYTIEEAKLTYQQRKNLPSSAFCGPNRTYPAHDAAHVRNAFARLAQFGNRLSPAVRARILACLKRKAKRFGIEHEETIRFHTKMVETPQEELDRIVERFVKTELPSLEVEETKSSVDVEAIRRWYLRSVGE